MALVVPPLSDTHVPSSDYPHEPLSLLFEDNHKETPRSCPAEGDIVGNDAFINAFVIAHLWKPWGRGQECFARPSKKRGAASGAPTIRARARRLRTDIANSRLPDHLQRFRLVWEAEDVGRVALMIGNDEVPVAWVDRPLRRVHLELVDPIREIGLEIRDPLRRVQGVGAPRRRIEGQDLGPEIAVRIGDIHLHEGYLSLPRLPREESRLLDHRRVASYRLWIKRHLDLQRLPGFHLHRLRRVDVPA